MLCQITMRLGPEDYREFILCDLSELSIKYPNGPQTSPFMDLWPICRKALRLQLQRNIKYFLVLDALDECRFGDQDRELKMLLNALTDFSRSSVLQIAIFSRPRPEFSDFASLHIPMDAKLLATDVRRFSSDEFGHLDIPSKYKKVVLDQIDLRAEGCFLWAKKYLEYLNEPYPDEIFLKRLYECPSGLWPIFDRMTQDVALSMTNRQKLLRAELSLVVCEAQKPLSLDEVAGMIELGSFDPSKSIPQVCRPLFAVKEGNVEFIHSSVKEYLTDLSRLTDGKPDQTLLVPSVLSHTRLATECLCRLLEPQYGSKRLIGQYIHRNYHPAEESSGGDDTAVLRGISFEYAWNYWDFHLAIVSDPEPDLLRLAQRFLHSFQFVFWSEYSVQRLRNLNKSSTARLRLRSWYSQLSDEKKVQIDIDDYFVDPYQRISEAYQQTEEEDRQLQWLALLRVGNYYVDIGLGDKAIPWITRATDGLIEVLGSEDPAVLSARTDRAILFLQQDKLREAYRDFADIARIEKEKLGTDTMEYFKTLYCRGVTESYLTRYDEAVQTLLEALQGALRVSGPEDPIYLQAQMWYCHPLVQLGNLVEAFENLTAVFQKRRRKYGDDDLFAASAQYRIGDIQRQQGKQTESLTNLKEAFATRRIAFPLDNYWSMDIAITLLITFRDFGLRQDAHAILNDLDQYANVGQV